MSPRVRKIILSHGLTGFICWYGVEKVFQKSIGISVLQVSLLAITYITLSAFLNVPTGILADRKGRRFTLVLATCSMLICTIVAGFSHNVWGYLVSILFWGFFYTTQNGAFEAILYDTLKEEGTEKTYAKASGFSNAAFWLAIFIASIIGAWTGSHYGLRTAYFITLIPNIGNIVLTLTLHEPKRQKHDPTASSFSMAKQGFSFLKSSPQIVYLTGSYLLIALFSWTPNEFGQLFFIELGFGVLVVGLLNACSGLFQAVGNAVGHRFTHISVKMMTSMLLVLFVTVFLIPTSMRFLAMGLFFLLVMLKQIFFITNDTALQHSLPSSIRATTLSSVGMLNDGMLVIAYFSFGLVSQHSTVKKGYLTVAVFGGVILLITSLAAKKLTYKPLPRFAVESSDGVVEIDSFPR